MIIGPGCSTGALRIAELAPFYNLTQVSNGHFTRLPSSIQQQSATQQTNTDIFNDAFAQSPEEDVVGTVHEDTREI